MMRIVSSPAMVPTASGSRARSSASASACAWPRPVRTDEQLLDAFDPAQELGGRALERGERRLRIRRVGARTLVGAVPRAFDQPEIRDVARDRRLRGVETALAQTAAQLLLAVERVAVDQFENQRLAACLHEPSKWMIIHRFLLLTWGRCV